MSEQCGLCEGGLRVRLAAFCVLRSFLNTGTGARKEGMVVGWREWKGVWTVWKAGEGFRAGLFWFEER